MLNVREVAFQQFLARHSRAARAQFFMQPRS